MIKINKTTIKYFLQRNFVKDTATLQVGTFFGTGLTFIASVVFARVLGPQDYGNYALIFAFVGFITIFMNWGADYATLTLLSEAWARKDKQEIKNLIIYFFKLYFYIIAGVGLLAVIFSPEISKHFYQNALIGQLARWILLAYIVRIMFFLLVIILQVVRRIKHLTIIENVNKAIYIIIPIALVLFGFGLQGIVWGHFLSAVLFLFFSIYFYKLLLNRTDLLPTFKEIFAGFKQVRIKKYFKFGVSIAIDKNLSNLYQVLPIVFLGMFAASADVGYFKIAFSYVGLSLMFLKPISRLLTVQLPKSKTYGYQELKNHFFKTTIYSFLIMLTVIVPMLLLAKFLIGVFYGQEYLPSLKLVYILCLYPLISSWGVGHGSLFRTLNKMKIPIKVNGIIILTTAPIAYFIIKNYALTGTLITVISWIFLPTFIYLIYIYKYFKKIKNENTNFA